MLQETIKKSQNDIQSGQNQLKMGHSGIQKNQDEAQKSFADLARKANVNIARNDAIKKMVGKMAKVPGK